MSTPENLNGEPAASDVETVALTSGDLTLHLAPALGGSVAAFRYNWNGLPIDLLRPLSPPAGAPANAVHSGLFPMLPFVNCIRNNRFEFEGRTYSVPPNIDGVRLNYHGSGWQSPWQVVRTTADHAELVLDLSGGDPVFRYTGTLAYRLGPDGLEVEIAVTNRDTRPMPFSFGFHPWFPRHSRTSIRFSASGRWLTDQEGHISHWIPLSGEDDYAILQSPPDTYWNTCYSSWDGTAEIIWPNHDLALTLTTDRIFGHLMMHVPDAGAGVFCLEPQTASPCGFDGLEIGRSGAGVVVLQPEETASGTMRLHLRSPVL